MFLLLAALLATAPGFEDLDRLEARVTAALDAGIGEPGGPAAPIDRRLRLAKCPVPAEIDPPALGAIALRCPALGWRIRMPLGRSGIVASGGMAIQQAAVRAAPIVRRGDPVEVRADNAGFSVVGAGIADEDGAAGARIRIRTDKTRPPIVAQVLDVGVVRVAAR